MILVVCLNPALDVTHHVAGVDWSGVNRPRQVRRRAGGKGLNVARTLHALGADVLVAGAGRRGHRRRRCAPGWRSRACPAAAPRIAAETRRTFAVVDSDRWLCPVQRAGTAGQRRRVRRFLRSV